MNFGFDCFHDVRSKPSLLLLNRFSIRFDIKMMHNHMRIEARYVFIALVKDIYILPYEIYEVLLLCWRQAFTYRNKIWMCLITHIDLDHLIFIWRFVLFEMLFLLKRSYWAHGSVSNGSMPSSCSAWLIDIMLAKSLLKTTPTLISKSQLDESEDCNGRDSSDSDS